MKTHQKKIVALLMAAMLVLCVVATVACTTNQPQDKVFEITTDLKDFTTGEKEYTFTATATYDNEACNVEVTSNGNQLMVKDGKYTVTFDKDGKYEIVIKAVSGQQSDSKKFVVTYSDGYLGQAIVSVEAFTVGCGYLVLPTYVNVYKDDNVAKLVDTAIKNANMTYVASGTIDENFYLTSVSGANLTGNVIDPVIKAALEGDKVAIDSESIVAKDGVWTLAAYDYCSKSGWMYTVNEVSPSVGMSEYKVKVGDVIRVQYSLDWGLDLSAVSEWATPVKKNDTNYNALNALAALILSDNYCGKTADKFNEQLTIVSKWDVTQAAIDGALKELTDFYYGA